MFNPAALTALTAPAASTAPMSLRVSPAVRPSIDVPSTFKKSLSATGGILLGPEYHFDLTRPGIGIYGCSPMQNCFSVLKIEIPVIQIREIGRGETVGYGNTWTAPSKRKIATISAGFQSGLTS